MGKFETLYTSAGKHPLRGPNNDRGFEVDIIRRTARDGDPHSLRMSPHDEDLWAVQIPSGDKILGAARFSQATDFSGS